MVKRTLELFDCDKCGNEGQRYSVAFPDGTLVMDRCETHAKALEKFRTEPGEWINPGTAGRQNFRKSSLTELRAAVESARNQGTSESGEPQRGKTRGA